MESHVKSCKRVLKRGLVNKHVNDFPRSYGGIISPDIDREGTALAGFHRTFFDDTQLHTHALTLNVDTLIVTLLKNNIKNRQTQYLTLSGHCTTKCS